MSNLIVFSDQYASIPAQPIIQGKTRLDAHDPVEARRVLVASIKAHGIGLVVVARDPIKKSANPNRFQNRRLKGPLKVGSGLTYLLVAHLKTRLDGVVVKDPGELSITEYVLFTWASCDDPHHK